MIGFLIRIIIIENWLSQFEIQSKQTYMHVTINNIVSYLVDQIKFTIKKTYS